MTTISKKESLLPTWTDELFDSGKLFNSKFFDDALPLWNKAGRIPSVNIAESDAEYSVELAAPGLNKSDFKVEVKNGAVVISSEKKEEKKEEKKNYTRREYSYSSFSRSFALPENCKEDKIEAKYENGVLHVSIPKNEKSAQQISKEIKVS